MSAPAHEQLIIRHLSGKISPEEQQALVLWLEESPENQRAFDEFRQVWALGAAEKAAPDFKTKQEWQRLEATLDAVDGAALKEKGLFNRQWGNIRIAATVAFLLTCAALFYTISQDNKELITKESGTEELHLVLADGSEVWLNRGSTLQYPESFDDDQRLVVLSGEAFFEVAHDASKPFVVHTDQAKVRVLGTSFNVKAFAQAPVAEVFVQSGSVGFSALGAEKERLLLRPGQKGVLVKKTQVLTLQQQDSNVLAWKTNKLVFSKATLAEVLQALEAYFGVQAEVADPALLACRFSSTFEDPALDEVLEVLRLSLNISIRLEGKSVKLEGEGCQAKEI